MKPSRTDRLDSEYQREISAIISGALKNKEPDLKGLISVTRASVAPDLKTAKVFVSIYAQKEQAEASFRILKDNAGFIRRELSHVMRTRTVPALTFVLDGTMEYGSHIDELLKSIQQDGDK